MQKTELALVGLLGLGTAVVAALLMAGGAAAAPRYPPAQFEYLDELLVTKRGYVPESIHNFITPDDVDCLYADLGSTLACYSWVCCNIEAVADIGEYWQYPVETVIRGAGDCEDNAFLLTSLIRNKEEAYAVLGWFSSLAGRWPHIWVACRECVFEPTLPNMPANPWRKESDLAATYEPMLYLTESEIYTIKGYPEFVTAHLGQVPDKQQAIEEFWRRLEEAKVA